MVGRTNQKEQEINCVGRGWRGRRWVSLKVLIGTQFMLSTETCQGQSQQLSLDTQNASKISKPQETEEHVWTPPCLFLPSSHPVSASLLEQKLSDPETRPGQRHTWMRDAQSHPPTVTAVTPMGDEERCHSAQTRHLPPVPSGHFPKQRWCQLFCSHNSH